MVSLNCSSQFKILDIYIFTDQHGNIHSNAVDLSNFKPPPLPVSNVQVVTKINSNKNSNGVTASDSVSSNSGQPKKESRLKHFFSPIRKKHIAPPNLTQPEPSQPDVFISNILPANMYLNPMHLKNMPDISSKSSENPSEISPTTSFQVNMIMIKTSVLIPSLTLNFVSLLDRRKS